MATRKNKTKRNTQSEPTLDDLIAGFVRILGGLSKRALMLVGALVVLLVLGVLLFFWLGHHTTISLEDEGKLTLSPTQIKSMEAIGEWEFLSISNEEIVDTIRHGFFGDDELVRIYYGTLRLGIDMHETQEGWISMQGDTVTAILPPIKLLDSNFIDEARTKSFYENGSWSQNDRAALYRKAYRVMLARCMNRKNIESAEQNASAQFYQLLRSMGFENIRIRFSNASTDTHHSPNP